MNSVQEFDDSSATRCANNDSLEEQNVTEHVMKSSRNDTITLTSIDEKNVTSDEKTQKKQSESESQDDDEARAFRSQFDEIKCASRMLEYSKNNSYNRFQGPAGRVPSVPLQRRTNESSFHQRSHSHSTHPQQANRQMLKHQRSTSSIQGLSFNGNPSTLKFYSPSYSYGFDNTDDVRHPFHYFDDSNSVNGNDDAFGRFGFNNSRFTDEWDDLSPPFTPLPLTPSSTYSSLSPSTPYFAQSNALLDDDELIEKAKRLEEERLLLQIQQRKLEIAAHKLRYQSSDPSLKETEARYKSNTTTPPLMPTHGKSLQVKPQKLIVPPPRFQTSQEPIGTPIRKSGYTTPPSSTTPTGISNSSLSSSAPAFSLFSSPPALSLNHNLMNQQQKHNRAMSSDNNNSLNMKYGSPLLTPSDSPPNNDGYFGFSSYNNNNIWANNNENNNHKPLTPLTPLTPSSYFRAPLYSSLIDEREEDSLFSDQRFDKGYENTFTNCSFFKNDCRWVD